MTTTKDLITHGEPKPPPPATPEAARGTTLSDIAGGPPAPPPHREKCKSCGGVLPKHRVGCVHG